MLKLFLPGNRTITLSILAAILGLLIQGDSQEIIHLAPMLRLVFTMLLTLILPMIPLFIRKAIAPPPKK